MNLLLRIAAGTTGGLFSRAAKWLIHFDYDKVRPDDEVRFTFLGAPEGWGVLITIACIVALVWLTFWLYRREGRASRRRKLFLAGVRTAAILLALLMFLEPALVVSKLYETPSPVVVLLDVSESVTIRDQYGSEPLAKDVARVTGRKVSEVHNQRVARQDIINGALNNPEIDLLNRLAAKNPVYVYGFGDSTAKLFTSLGGAGDAGSSGDAANEPGRYQPGDLKIEAASGRTYVGRAVNKILENPSGEPLAAVIILSDFQDNDPDLDATSSAGKYASREGVPVFGVPIGLSKSSETRNLKVDKNLRANRTLFVGDPAEFVALVSSEGYSTGERVRAELFRKKTGSRREERVAGEDVLIEAKATAQPVALTHIPLEGEEGEYVYTMRIGPLEGEHLKRDNMAVATGVRIAKTLTNVLLIAGSPTWEYRNLKSLLTHDRSVVLSCWLQGTSKEYPQVGNRLLRRLPMTDEEIFDPKDGPHVMILLDIDPTDFSLEWFRRLEKFVRERAGGLLYVAGEKRRFTFELFEKRSFSAPLIGMLPVVLDLGRAEVAVGAGTKGYRLNPLRPTEDGLQSPLLKFSTERELTERIWQTLPGSIWSFPIRNAKPGATVLIRTMDKNRRISVDGKSVPMPVLVTSFYGKGRVAFMGFDETWRWRKLSEGRVYDTFWTQAVRSLVEGRLLGGKKSVLLETDSETYPLATPVTITVKEYDPSGKPSSRPGVEVKIEMTAGTDEDDSRGLEAPATVKLRPVPNALGTYRRQFVPRRTGYYKLSVVGVAAEGAATTSIEVASQFEFDHPETNRVRLAELVDPAAGGGVVELKDLPTLPDRIESKKKQVFEAGKPDSLWANPLCLGLMALLLGIEWAVRKRSNMA